MADAHGAAHLFGSGWRPRPRGRPVLVADQRTHGSDSEISAPGGTGCALGPARLCTAGNVAPVTNTPPTVTIQEVAALARVSAKTVSRVINNEPRVRADTRARILHAIEELNYRPNLNARGLASNRSFLIGLFCDRPGDYQNEFQSGAYERCRAASMHLMVEPLDVQDPAVGRQIDTLLGQLRLQSWCGDRGQRIWFF